MLELTEDVWVDDGTIRLTIIGDSADEVRKKAEEYKAVFSRYRARIVLDAMAFGNKWLATVTRLPNKL